MRIKCYLLTPTSDTVTVTTEYGNRISTLYSRSDTGEKITLSEAGPGAMWYADWLAVDKDDYSKGFHMADWSNQVTPPLIVRTPGGDWVIDSRASNCTLKSDRIHRCWCRHGNPPDITVDKQGFTCAAGAGSIQSGDYHGFLRNGYLEQC